MIETLSLPPSEDDLRGLATLLIDAVDAGASVGFVAPLTIEEARAWWQRRLANDDPRFVVLVARDDDGIIGTVQLIPAAMPNQPHRGDISKLLVHRRARGRGVGKALMRAIEARARENGIDLLVLDTKRGDAAETLYRRDGWTEVGVIPRYALNPDGSECDTVVFFKDLS